MTSAWFWLADPETKKMLPADDSERRFMEDLQARTVKARHWKRGWIQGFGPNKESMWFRQCYDECCR